MIPVLAALVYFFSEKVIAQAEADKKSEEVVKKDDASKENETKIFLRANGKIEVDGQIIEVAQLAELINSKATVNTLARISADPEVAMGFVADVQKVLREEDVRRAVYEKDGKLKEDLKEEVYSIVFGSYFQTLSKAEYYSQTKFRIKYPDGELEEFTYYNLPEKYKNTLTDPPGPISLKVPNPELFETWKNGDKVALWLNGKVIPNSKLEEMKVNEIAYYNSSFVHSNARSERFPQNYQVNIYTLSGFENTYGKNSNFGKTPIGGTATFNSENPKNQAFTSNSYPVSSYQIDFIRFQENLNSGAPFIEKSKTEQERLVQMFYDLGGKYSSLRAEDKKKVELPENPHLPYYRLKNDKGIYYKLEKDLSEEEKKHFSKTPPIFPYDKNIVTVSNYLKEFGEFQVKINKNRLFAQPSNQEIMGLQSHFRSLEASYNSLPFEERKKVKRASFPYVQIEKDGKVIFKRFEDLTDAERKALTC